jgi:hypothetical protein
MVMHDSKTRLAGYWTLAIVWFTEKVTGQAQWSYGARLRNLSLLSLESHCMQADLISVYKIRHGLAGISLDELASIYV